MRYRLIRGFLFIGLLGTGSTSLASWQGRGDVPLEQVGPVSLIVAGLLPLAWRAPYCAWRGWDYLVGPFSLLLVAVGGFTFRPDDTPGPVFQAFFAVYLTLATAYGYFCTATPPDSPRRSAVIEPVKRLSRLGIPGVDLGLVLAPLAFPWLWLGHEFKRSGGDAGAKGPQ